MALQLRHFSTTNVRVIRTSTTSIIIGRDGSSRCCFHSTAAVASRCSYGNNSSVGIAQSKNAEYWSCRSRQQRHYADLHNNGRRAFGSSPVACADGLGHNWSLGNCSNSSSLTSAANKNKQRTTAATTKSLLLFRSFHGTPRQEILPLIGVATIVLVGRYSIKAWQRMEADWEDYYWQLERYERLQQQQQTETSSSSSSSLQHHANTIAIDLGSVYTKLATFSSLPPSQQQQQQPSNSSTARNNNQRRIPEILITQQGDRSFFNGILYTEYPPTRAAPATRGKAALEKFYYDRQEQQQQHDTTTTTTTTTSLEQQQENKVTLPWKDLEQGAGYMDVSNVVADVLSPALKESLERLDDYEDVYKKGILGSSGNNNKDNNSHNKNHHHHHVRAVVTLPVQFLHRIDSYRTAFDKIWKDFHSNNENENDSSTTTAAAHAPPATIFLPDAVAAIWGAQALGILPDDYLNELATVAAAEKQKVKDNAKKESSVGAEKQHGRHRRPQKRIMVVDVGGFTSQFSIVDEYHMVRSIITIPWGGETIIERMGDCLLDAEKAQDESRTIADNDARALSTLQLHARQALPSFALRSKSQVNIHVPYFFATPGNHHLDTVLSRSVLEQVIQNDVRQRLVAQLLVNNDKKVTTRRLSPHMPVPNDMASLFTSILTQLLESAHETPQSIHHILLVGGASQFPLVQASLESSVSMLWGSGGGGAQQQKLLVVPTTSVHATELVVLGAATMLPSFTYNVNRGLERSS